MSGEYITYITKIYFPIVIIFNRPEARRRGGRTSGRGAGGCVNKDSKTP